jgi:hypothetical protein
MDGQPVTDGDGRKLEVEVGFQEIPACDAVLVLGFVPDDCWRPEMSGSRGSLAPRARRFELAPWHGSVAAMSRVDHHRKYSISARSRTRVVDTAPPPL